MDPVPRTPYPVPGDLSYCSLIFIQKGEDHDMKMSNWQDQKNLWKTLTCDEYRENCCRSQLGDIIFQQEKTIPSP